MPLSEIEQLRYSRFDEFIEYLRSQLATNGKDGDPIYQPVAQGEEFVSDEKAANFKDSMMRVVGDKGWRRFWIATNNQDEIVGHIDLRARPEPHTQHRVLLGMGLLKEMRGLGIGSQLLHYVIDWVRGRPNIEWIDLCVMSENKAALSLYRKFGFELQGEYKQMFAIDGEYHDYLSMTKHV